MNSLQETIVNAVKFVNEAFDTGADVYLIEQYAVPKLSVEEIRNSLTELVTQDKIRNYGGAYWATDSNQIKTGSIV